MFLTPDFLAIAMEYAPGGDMFQHVKKMGGLWVRYRASHTASNTSLHPYAAYCQAYRLRGELPLFPITAMQPYRRASSSWLPMATWHVHMPIQAPPD